MSTNNVPNKLKAQVRATETHCWRCGQRIDWTIPFWDEHGNVNKQAGTVEHTIPRSKAPHLIRDPGACKASHQSCNAAAGARDPKPGLGINTQQF